MPRRATVFICAIVTLLAALGLSSVGASGSAEQSATASAKKCKKGYKRKTVTIKRHGKQVKVKRCRKIKKGTNGGGGDGGGGGAAGLFEAPGRQLAGNDALPFLQRYLANSRFTDCPAGWPSCAVEERYSHFADGSFYYCRLTPSSGSDIKSSQEYAVKNAVVEPDGSWTFNEEVSGGGFYEWRVSTDGTVVGAYQFNGGAFEQLGPFQYVSGARDCDN